MNKPLSFQESIDSYALLVRDAEVLQSKAVRLLTKAGKIAENKFWDGAWLTSDGKTVVRCDEGITDIIRLDDSKVGDV